MIWNPGDDTDLNEGGAGTDTVEVNGGNGAEQFTTTANGTRVRFDRVTPAPFSIDIGTSREPRPQRQRRRRHVLRHRQPRRADPDHASTAARATTRCSAATASTSLLGGDGNDFVDGQQGNDTALLGAGDDTFQWDPGDGSDMVEGQDGADAMMFNGANIATRASTSRPTAGGSAFTRDIANIVMDLNDVETIDVKVARRRRQPRVNDLSRHRPDERRRRPRRDGGRRRRRSPTT